MVVKDKQKTQKFKKIKQTLATAELEYGGVIDIVMEYLEEGCNLSRLAKKYGIPYSSFRRYIKAQLKERDLEAECMVDYINVEDFEFLSIGETFQYADWLTKWKVVCITRRESEKVFQLVPTKVKSERHWVGDVLS